MNRSSYAVVQPALVLSQAASAARRAAVAMAGRAQAAARRRRDLRLLMSFDDRMLKDIGLSRADVEGAQRG